MSKHAQPEPQIEGKPVGNLDPNRRGRGGTAPVGQPPAGKGRHSIAEDFTSALPRPGLSADRPPAPE